VCNDCVPIPFPIPIPFPFRSVPFAITEVSVPFRFRCNNRSFRSDSASVRNNRNKQVKKKARKWEIARACVIRTGEAVQAFAPSLPLPLAQGKPLAQAQALAQAQGKTYERHAAAGVCDRALRESD